MTNTHCTLWYNTFSYKGLHVKSHWSNAMVNFTILALYILEAPLGANCMIIPCLTVLLFTLPVLLLCMIQCNTVPLQVKKISTNLHAYINRMQTTYCGYQKRFIEFSFILQNENLIVLCAWFGFYCYLYYMAATLCKFECTTAHSIWHMCKDPPDSSFRLFLTGEEGTGKSHVIGAIGEHLECSCVRRTRHTIVCWWYPLVAIWDGTQHMWDISYALCVCLVLSYFLCI